MARIQTILVPSDFSKDAEEALEYAIDLAQVFKARVHLLHVHHPIVMAPAYGYGIPAGVMTGIREAAGERIEREREEASKQGIEVTAEVFSGAPSIGIVEVARKLPADLIVMGTRGLTGLRHVVLGSVTERTLRHAPCPVLTLNSKSREEDSD